MKNEEKNIKESIIWYSIGGILNACQSAIILIVISHTCTIEEAGIYSIAYAIAGLSLMVGNWGIRNYQSTDIGQKYTFSTYFSTRIITDAAMLLVIIFYIVRGRAFLDYSWSKCVVIIILGLFKLIDSVEDVFHGLYQNRGRLEIAGKCLSTRYLIMLLSFSTGLVLTNNLVISATVSLLCTFIYFVFTIKITFGLFDVKCKVNVFFKENYILLVECISIFCGNFLTIYIANAPKYAIDEFCTEADQACFNYIFMPVYVVNMLNTFIYQPVLTKMASLYSEKKTKEFIKMFLRQLFLLVVLSLLVLFASFVLGIPVLSVLYNTSLLSYKTPFMILMLGSCFLALSGYLVSNLILMRKQNWLLLGYGVSALIAILFSKISVLTYGIYGAVCLYTGIIIIQTVIFIVEFVIFYNLKRKDSVDMKVRTNNV